MKTIIFILLSIFSLTAYSQDYSGYTIDFEDPLQFYRLKTDTNSNPNNIWQIGTPQKTIFTSAYSIPYAIVTDTTNPYPVNDTSMFIVKHVSDMMGGFQWPHTVILAGRFQVNSDTLNDFGMIEFSPDNGNIWINLLTDTYYQNQGCYEWWSSKPILSGNSLGWTDFYVWVAGFGPVFNIQPGDTVLYRFTFISDNIQTNKDGLMYDDLHFEDWTEGIKKIQNRIASKSYPNPTLSILTIEFENIDNSIYEVFVYNEIGQQALIKKTTNQSKMEIDMESLSNGIYYYKLTNLTNRQFSFGKILKN